MSANLASATSTRIESAARHQIPVKVSYEHLLSWMAFDQTRMQKEKMAVCMHKDDLAIGCSRPVRRNENGRGNQRNKPYPTVVSTLASMEPSARHYLIRLLHNPRTFADRDAFVRLVERRMDHWDPSMNEVCRKQIDKLQTNHRGVFVLKDQELKWLRRLPPDEESARVGAIRILAFPCGLIRGALACLGLSGAVVSCDFLADGKTMASCSFNIKVK